MHGKRDTTDIYIWLPDNDVAKRIESLTHQAQSVFSECNNNTALVEEIADAVAKRLLDKTEGAPQAGHPPLVGAPGFEPGASTTPL